MNFENYILQRKRKIRLLQLVICRLKFYKKIFTSLCNKKVLIKYDAEKNVYDVYSKGCTASRKKSKPFHLNNDISAE